MPLQLGTPEVGRVASAEEGEFLREDVCDRCGHNYPPSRLRLESGNVVVCFRCYDGSYDKKKHPQNYPARVKKESRPVPNGRPQYT